MTATAKEKFDAAVNVIHSLPKNGSYKPSYVMMLSFYALYKQATLGPCNIGKPAFWDVVGRAKWDAWNRLENMPKEDAMNRYVDELKKIIETMPATENVQEFVERLGDFYEVVEDDTPVARMVRNASPKHRQKSADGTEIQNGSFSGKDFSSDSSSGSPENTPQLTSNGIVKTSFPTVGDTLPENKSNNSYAPGHGEIASDSGSDGEEFCDSIDVSLLQDKTVVQKNVYQDGRLQNSSNNLMRSGGGDFNPEGSGVAASADHLSLALSRLQKDMSSALVRLQAMETLFLAQKEAIERNQRSLRKPNKWKLFASINYPTVAFLVAWPFVVHLIMRYLGRKRT